MMAAQFRVAEIVSTLTRVLIAPASNLRVAVLLYSTIGVFLLLVLVIGILFIMSSPDDEAAEQAESQKRVRAKTKRRVAAPVSPKARIALAAGIVVVLSAVWVIAGYTTSEPALCKSCHWSTFQHAKAEASSNPHSGVTCVACHESGGTVGRFVTGVPLRTLHLVTASRERAGASDYGGVTARACIACHSASLEGTATNSKRGLKVSHAEPLAAAARCIECHTLRQGVVGVYNAGMKPCLRCHNGQGKVSTACVTCHEGGVSAATRARTTSFRAQQVKDISCGGCHNEKQECDPCHATRMPHSTAFKSGAHARAAAVDFWYNGGKSCGHCHTATRRPCTQCHTNLLGKAHGTPMAASHKIAAASRCNTCHLEYAPVATRDFCKDVCHSSASESVSPR